VLVGLRGKGSKGVTPVCFSQLIYLSYSQSMYKYVVLCSPPSFPLKRDRGFIVKMRVGLLITMITKHENRCMRNV